MPHDPHTPTAAPTPEHASADRRSFMAGLGALAASVAGCGGGGGGSDPGPGPAPQAPAPTPAPPPTPSPSPAPTPSPTPAPTPSPGTTPRWLQGVAVDQWVEIPGSSMRLAPVGMVATGTDPASRMDAWNGFALKGTAVYSVRQGGHGDYFGNEVLRIDLGGDTPVWAMVKPSSPASVVTDNSSRYTDGSPAAVHGYHSQRYIAQRDWVLSVGTTAMSRQGGTNGDCVVYDVASNRYLPRGTVPDLPPMVLAEYGVWDDPATGDVYQTAGYVIHRWNQAANSWSLRVADVPTFYGFASVCCTDTTRRRALLLAGDPAARVPQLFTFATQSAQSVTPTGDRSIVDSAGHYGMVFCPATDRFYAMQGGAAGSGLYEIHPTTFAVSAKATTGGGALPAAAASGVFTRFLYVAALGGIVYFPRYAANAWFLRLH